MNFLPASPTPQPSPVSSSDSSDSHYSPVTPSFSPRSPVMPAFSPVSTLSLDSIESIESKTSSFLTTLHAKSPLETKVWIEDLEREGKIPDIAADLLAENGVYNYLEIHPYLRRTTKDQIGLKVVNKYSDQWISILEYAIFTIHLDPSDSQTRFNNSRSICNLFPDDILNQFSRYQTLSQVSCGYLILHLNGQDRYDLLHRLQASEDPTTFNEATGFAMDVCPTQELKFALADSILRSLNEESLPPYFTNILHNHSSHFLFFLAQLNAEKFFSLITIAPSDFGLGLRQGWPQMPSEGLFLLQKLESSQICQFMFSQLRFDVMQGTSLASHRTLDEMRGDTDEWKKYPDQWTIYEKYLTALPAPLAALAVRHETYKPWILEHLPRLSENAVAAVAWTFRDPVSIPFAASIQGKVPGDVWEVFLKALEPSVKKPLLDRRQTEVSDLLARSHKAEKALRKASPNEFFDKISLWVREFNEILYNPASMAYFRAAAEISHPLAALRESCQRQKDAFEEISKEKREKLKKEQTANAGETGGSVRALIPESLLLRIGCTSLESLVKIGIESAKDLYFMGFSLQRLREFQAFEMRLFALLGESPPLNFRIEWENIISYNHEQSVRNFVAQVEGRLKQQKKPVQDKEFIQLFPPAKSLKEAIQTLIDNHPHRRLIKYAKQSQNMEKLWADLASKRLGNVSSLFEYYLISEPDELFSLQSLRDKMFQ